MFSQDALEKGIEKCKENIKVFEDAIQKEYDTIKEYRNMINTLEEKDRKIQDFKSRIEIDNG